MEVLLIALVVLIILGKSGGFSASVQAATTPVIQNSTGASLSNALGTKSRTPDYYATGNPQYSTDQSSAPSAVAGPSVSPSPAPSVISQTTLPPPGTSAKGEYLYGRWVPYGTPASIEGVKAGMLPSRFANAPGTSATVRPLPITRTVPVSNIRYSPETASSPWTKLPAKRVSALATAPRKTQWVI